MVKRCKFLLINIIGFLGGLYQLFVVVGILYSSVFGRILSNLQMNVACALWSCIHIASVHFMPESPYYLIRTNQLSKVNEEIVRLRHSEHDCTTELQNMQVMRFLILFYILISSFSCIHFILNTLEKCSINIDTSVFQYKLGVHIINILYI